MKSSLPAQIRALMRNTITWEGFVGQDGFADEIYAEPRTIKCWIEEKAGYGGIQRKQSAGGITDDDPKFDVFIAADDIDGQTVSMRDRWTFTMNGQSWTTQADRVSVVYGHDSTPWLVELTL